MGIKLAAALLLVLAIGYGMARVGRYVAAQWFLVRLWRWLSGQPHHGHPITDSGWFRRGQNVLTRTGHASRWWHLPRWKRAAHRTGGTLAAVVIVAGVFVNPLVTAIVLGAVLLALGSWGAVLVARHLRVRKDQRTWLYPLHLAAHELAGHPRAIRAASWITAELDDSGAVRSAKLELPQGWPADELDKKRLVAVASAKLAIQNAEPKWQLAGPAPLLRLIHSPPPPGEVLFADVIEEMAKCKPDELLIGIGKNGEPIRASLGTDSPHIAISMGTGAGKSNLAGFLLLQMLIRGAIGQVLDAKRRLSYPWLLKNMQRELDPVPNVAYAWRVEEIHDSMVWLGSTELDRRGDVAFAGQDTTGKVHANVGAPLFTIAEELNLVVPRLKEYWSEVRVSDDPKKSPAFTGLGAGAFAGREVDEHLMLVGQMLTAEVTGSRDSSVREQCGIVLLARYRQKGWQLMCGDLPMPPPPTELGRVQVVTAGGAREAQVPKLDRIRARQMVLDGIISPLPSNMPCKPELLVTGRPAINGYHVSPAGETVSGPVAVSPAPDLVSLREAARSGKLAPDTTWDALSMARYRGQLPKHRDKGKRGAHLYDLAELVAWDASRR